MTSKFAQSLRARRLAHRNAMALQRAIDGASTPSMRDELIHAAQRDVRSW